MGKSIADFIAPILGTAAGSLIGNPELGFLPELGSAAGGAIGAGIGSGVTTGVETGNPLAGLTSGLASGAGSYVGSNLLGGIGAGGDTASGVAGTAGSGGAPIPNAGTSLLATGAPSQVDNLIGAGTSGSSNLFSGGGSGLTGGGFGDSLAGQGISSSAGNAASSGGVSGLLQTPMSSVIGQATGSPSLGSTLGQLTGSGNVGNALGSTAGGALAQNAISPIMSGIVGGPSTGSPPPGIQPNMTLPGDLSQFGGLDPNQQLSNIATQGVYGNGLGGQDQQYFLNQLNNQLTTGPGQYSNISNVSPIEQSLLSRLGLGGFGDTQSLLTAMNSWQPPTT